MLNRGESPLKGDEPGLPESLKKVVDAGKFRCTPDFSEIAGCDAVTLAIQMLFADPKDLIPSAWAFIQNSNDTRNTPAEPYLVAMEEAEAKVRVCDPFVDDYPGLVISRDLAETLAGTDVVTIFTAHHHYASLDPARMKELSGGEHPVIIVGRNIVDPGVFIRAGFIYKGIGRGDRNSHPIRRSP